MKREYKIIATSNNIFALCGPLSRKHIYMIRVSPIKSMSIAKVPINAIFLLNVTLKYLLIGKSNSVYPQYGNSFVNLYKIVSINEMSYPISFVFSARRMKLPGAKIFGKDKIDTSIMYIAIILGVIFL